MASNARIVGRRAVARTVSLGSPVGGWNARDALSDMEATDAVTMENWYPSTSDSWLRLGATPCSWGMDGTVESLMEYVKYDGTRKYFSVTDNGSIYDITSGVTAALAAPGTGAIATITTETGFGNGRFQYINAQTSSTTAFLLAVNGEDKLEGFDGTNWWTDGDGTHDITGVDTATCIHIHVHKFRIWLIQKNTLKAWYLGTSAISGAATGFDLSGTAQCGGSLMAMATWTIDAGYGVDDYAVFITSEGEVIVYGGPNVASDWKLVGVWKIGAPMGRRCFTKWAGDLLIITHDGLVPLSGALQSSRLNPRVALTDKIQFAMSAATSTYGDNFGWQVMPYPKENQLYLNVPVSEGVEMHQYVMNIITKSWCKFKGWNANVLATFDHALFYGGEATGIEPYADTAGVVWAAWTGNTDYTLDNPSGVTDITAASTDGTTVTITANNRYAVGDSVVIAGLSASWNGTYTVTGLVGAEGNSTGFTYTKVAAGPIADETGTSTATPNWVGVDIVANLQQAFNYYKGPTQLKRFTMIRPVWTTNAAPVPIYGNLNVDFQITEADTSVLTTGPVSSGDSAWDTATWDLSPWGGLLSISRVWQGVYGLGYCAAPHYVVSAQGLELRLMATDIVYETGGVV